MSDKPKPGPTGKFPWGKAYSDDEGELNVAIAADPAAGVVRLDFGTSVKWVSLPPASARELAAVLIAKAAECEKGRI